jgi:2-phosphosulfolactate phosphatase
MPTVEIDCFHGEMPPVGDASVVAVDVLRASTTAVTAVANGCSVWPVVSEAAAWALRAENQGALLAGELGGEQPIGFQLQNSPTEVLASTTTGDSVILLSSSGSKLMAHAGLIAKTYISCLRNVTAQAEHLLRSREDVVILGAGTQGTFRIEDRLCAARIAGTLIGGGYCATTAATATIVDEFAATSTDALLAGASARFLRDSGQADDVHFVIDHVDDLAEVFLLEEGRVIGEGYAS